jgi:hypothetical protein
LMLQVEALMIGLILVAAVRARSELIGSHGLSWPLLLGVLAMLAGSAYLWVTHERHPRRLLAQRGTGDADGGDAGPPH